MCGIAGVVDKGGRLSPEALRAAVERMNGAIAHRGPDDAGVWLSEDGRVALGHRRLSVIDTSAAGHQPMVADNESGRHALVFNGEIYNFRDLQPGLERAGFRFRSHSDTEVLLGLLGLQAERCLEWLDGMFAFGHYHEGKRSLLLARDAFGEKPLYYWDGPDYFIFASELSALLASGLFQGEIGQAELAAYLHFRYVPQPATIFRDICKLEPGAFLRLDLAQGRLEKKRHFTFRISEDLPLNDPRQILDLLERELVQAVKSRLVADVPLGAFLSSGVDSSLVCALATRKLGVPLNTYTIAFGGGKSEHVEAARIAGILGTRHHCHTVSELDLLDVAARMGEILDEPNGDRSCVPTYVLSRFARQDLTVALSGDGGDELFCGYGRYFAAQTALGADVEMPQLAPAYFERFLPVMSLDQLIQVFGRLPEGFQDIYASLILPLAPTHGTLNRLRALDAWSYLPGAVLGKVDRMSMAHGLEVRAPLLSTAVAKLAGRIPIHLQVMDGKGKFFLRSLLKRYLPAELVDREKTGFGMPTGFFQAHARFFGEQLAAALTQDAPLARVLDVKRLRALLPQANNNIIWAVIVLNQWLGKVLAVRPQAGGEAIDLGFGRESHAPEHGHGMRDLLTKALPRSQDTPPPGLEDFIAAFDAAGVAPGPVNVFTYHTQPHEDAAPIETFDIKGLDHRRFNYEYILAYFSCAAAGHLPGCNVILVTDATTAVPAAHRFTHIVRLRLNPAEPMYERVRAMAAYVNSQAFNAPTLFLDSDAFVGADLSPELAGDFDIATTFRPDSTMVLNEGVQAASHRRPGRARAFYNGYLATYQALAQDPDVLARYPGGIKRWRGGQLSLNACAWNGVFPSPGELRDVEGTRVLYLPCDEYNHKPLPSDGIRHLISRKIAHFKGTAKEFATLRRYTLEKNPPGWALADLRLAGVDPADDGALLAAVQELLGEKHYQAAKSLCLDLIAETPERGLPHALLASIHLRVEGDAEAARGRIRQARGARLTPALETELDRMEKNLETLP